MNNGSYQKILQSYSGQGAIPANWYQQLTRYQQLYSFEDGQ